jgi:adenosine deaminase CECR1
VVCLICHHLNKFPNTSDHEFRLSLSPAAHRACKIVSQIRDEERRNIWNQDEIFPGMVFNVAKNHMESTKLWKIVKQMPKGTLLHAHMGATVDLDFIFNKAIDTPGMCISSSLFLNVEDVRDNTRLQIRYSSTCETGAPSIWTEHYPPDTIVPLKEAAEAFPNGGRVEFVAWMKAQCSITQADTLEHHLGVDDIWRRLTAAFTVVGPIIYYEPILRALLQKLFTNLLEDNVRWAELRAIFSSPFFREGEETPAEGITDLLRVLNEEIKKFTSSEKGKNFWGARLIWTSLRAFGTEKVIEGRKSIASS